MGKSWKKNVRIIIEIILKNANKKLVLKLRCDAEKTLGISKKMANGLVIPPDKYSKLPNWIISITKNNRANLLYKLLSEKLKNEKHKINDPLFVHFLYNLVSFIRLLSEIPYLLNTPIYHSLHRLFVRFRKFLLGTSSGLF